MVRKAKHTSPTLAASKGEKRPTSIKDQISSIEQEISNTKYNKRTQHHVGMLKAKIAQLREKQEARSRGSAGPGDGYSVRKTGDGTAVLLGFPSVGKSTLLNALTNQESAVGAYAFTTLSVIPGLLEYKDAKIQILDVPGIVEGAAAGTGRGKEVLQVLRNADLIIRLIDVFSPQHYAIINREAHAVGIRMNKKRPDIKITKASKGGIDIGSTVRLTRIDRQTIVDICKSFRIVNAAIVIRDDIDADDLIDVIMGNCVYIPAITVVNKMDLAEQGVLHDVMESVEGDLAISAHTKMHIDQLKQLIFDRLALIRIYLKEIGKKADLDEPLIMHQGQTLKNVCEKLHKDFVGRFKFARVWGPSARFDGQQIRNLNHVVCDTDVLEFHLR